MGMKRIVANLLDRYKTDETALEAIAEYASILNSETTKNGLR